jgi:flagella basal body P-ring formation protein FlgA
MMTDAGSWFLDFSSDMGPEMGGIEQSRKMIGQRFHSLLEYIRVQSHLFVSLRFSMPFLLLLASLPAAEIRLRPQVSIAANQARLTDIADIDAGPDTADRLAQLAIQKLPDVGMRELSASEVFARIRRELPELRVTVHGHVRMERAQRVFTAEQLAAAAIAHAKTKHEEAIRIKLARACDAIAIPADDQTPARLIVEPLTHADTGELPYRVRILRDQRELARELVVLHLYRQVTMLVTVVDLPRSHILKPSDVRAETRLLTPGQRWEHLRLAQVVGTELRRAVVAGTDLQQHLLRELPLVRGGGTVRLVHEQGRIALRCDGTALSDGRLGDQILVRPSNGGHPLRAVVAGPGVARVQLSR